MDIQPYLFFNGRCEEAINFYRNALDAHPGMLMRFRDSPEPPPPGQIPPDWDDKIMHADLRIGDCLLMLSDGCAQTAQPFQGFSLSLTVPDAATADRMFNALADGGEVQMPLGETFWSPYFGMVTDRFGLAWMITMPPQTTDPA
jgi:PhnB protein